MSRIRLTRTHLLLALVVVLLAAVPVLIPLLVTKGDPDRPGDVRLASGAGAPAVPEAAPAPRSGASADPPARAGRLIPPATRRPSTPSPTTSAASPPPTSTAAPTTVIPSPASPSTTTPQPTTAEPTTPQPTTTSPTASAEVLSAGVNLVVAGLSAAPQSPADGQPVVFSAVVRNTGTDPTPALPTGVAFAVDGTVVSWSASDTTPLGPGEERTFTAADGVAGAAWTATRGEHTIEATVDDTGQIPEQNEDDNTATTHLHVS